MPVSSFEYKRANNLSGHESVLVVILAETRAHEYTFAPFKKNVLDRMNADLCLCVAKNPREHTDNAFYENARYVWTYEEPEDWGDAFDSLQQEMGTQNNWRKLLTIKDQWLGGVKGPGAHPGSAGILLFFRSFLKRLIQEHGMLEQYDRFIITRSDFMHLVPHVPLSLMDPKYIWIPDGEDYGGYTDRHIVVHRNDVMDVLSIGDRIVTEPDALYGEMAFHAKWNLEKFIKFSFTRLGLAQKVRRFPYTMYTIRPPEGHTRWSKGYFSERLGYSIKYHSEYEGYKLAALLLQDQEDWNKRTLFLYTALRRLLRYKFSRITLKLLQIDIFKRVK